MRKRIEYENQIFFYMIADAMRFNRREELGRSFMVQFIDYDENYVELYFPDVTSEARYDEIAQSSTIEENEAAFMKHLLDDDSRNRYHALMHPDRDKIINEGKWCYDGMFFVEKDGAPHYMQYYHLYDIDEDTGHLISYTMTIFADVFKREWDKIQRRAQRDQLTGLYNRYMLQEVFAEYQDEHYGEAAVVVVLDADKFKDINDTYGHDAGDEALKALTRRMQQVFYNRNQMVLFRLGGDEFAAFLKSMDIEQAESYIKRMVKKPVTFGADGSGGSDGAHGTGGSDGSDGAEISFSVSVGYTEMEPGDTLDTALKRADDALYEVKRNGGNGAIRQ